MSRFRSAILAGLIVVAGLAADNGPQPTPETGLPVVLPEAAAGPNEVPLPTLPGDGSETGGQPFASSLARSPDHPWVPYVPLFQPIKADFTWLPRRGEGGLGVDEFEASATHAFELTPGFPPVLLTPGAAVRVWERPRPGPAGVPPDLPGQVFDAYLDVGWKPQLAAWLFTDLGVTPGWYGDGKSGSPDSFKMRGRGLAIVALSPQWQFVGGVLYVNRNKTKILPAGGVIWNPSEDTRCRLVFPAPRISHRFTTVRTTQWWGYLAGEYGGGRWAVERADGRSDSLDYTDLRLLFGMEWITPGKLSGHLEAGYVFDRRINFTSATPDFRPGDTFLVRAGIAY